MNITVQELAKITEILLKFIKEKEKDIIPFKEEDTYYQKVWHADRNLYKIPTVTLGYLDEDVENLRLLLKGDPPSNYDLERLGVLFTSLGATLR